MECDPLGIFFLFYYYNWSSCFLFLPMWLTRMVGLDKTHIGMVFSSFAVAAICLQPLLGWVTDKLGPKKHLLWLIVILMVLFAPFFIYVYTPLLQSHFAIGLVMGGLYLGFIFHAGYGAVEAFVEKVSRNRGFEYGRPGCLVVLDRRPARRSPVLCMALIRHGFTGLVRRWLYCW